MRIRVVTDSTSDLPREICRALDITVIPLNVHFGDTVYQDGQDLPAEEFYRKLESSPIFPQTSTKPPDTFAQTYRRLAQEADAILSIHISAAFSGTLNAARLGSMEAGVPVEIVDSQSASMGLGLLTILAARMAREGASLGEIRSRLDRAIPNTAAYGLFDTLQYLQRGGRIGRAQAFLGSLLRIKPVIAIKGGTVVPIRKARTVSQGLGILCELALARGMPQELSVMQTSDPEAADRLTERLAASYPPERIYRTTIGPVIGCHVGPRAVGVSVIYMSA